MFKIKSFKKDELTLQNIRDAGWKELGSGPLGEADSRTLFEKDNYTLVCYNTTTHGPVVEFYAKDPSKIDWMLNPENFRVSLPCPTEETFVTLTNLLPKYKT
jgi:hypothetical protein